MPGIETIKRVLITGGTGLLGIAIQQVAPAYIQGYSVYFPDRPLPKPLPFPIQAADVTNRTQMHSVFKQTQPDVVIHTAAMGSVDFAERNHAQARQVNVGGTEVIVALCHEFQSRLVYISSNAVFNGQTPLYSETAPTSPINYYGLLKVEAEKIVQESNIPWAIVRPILLYGWPYPGERDNPVVWWVRSLEQEKPIKVVNNVFSKPLPAWSCAEVVWALVDQEQTGIFHAAGSDHVSLYQFALMTAEAFELNTELIESVPDSAFPEIAPRPKDTSFDTSKIEKELGIKPIRIKDGLVRMKAERNTPL